MNRLLGLIVILSIFSSCQKQKVIIISNPNEKNVLHIHVSYCPVIHCNTQVDISDVEVSLFKSKDDAITESNPIVSTYTNEEGLAKIEVEDQEQVYIRTEYLDMGIYISEQALDVNMDTQHEIIYKANLIFNASDSLELRQNHISFEYPTVGQKSSYKFHHNFGEVSTALPENYLFEELTLEITEQLDESTFVIKEHLNHGPNQLVHYDSLCYNIWKFNDDGIVIKTFDTTYTHDIFSFILGEHSYTVVNPEDGLSFPFTDCSPETIDIETVDFNSINWHLCYQLVNYILFDKQFDQLSLHFDSWGFLDGDDRMRFFNKSDGIVRYIGINRMAWRTYGFDLILD